MALVPVSVGALDLADDLELTAGAPDQGLQGGGRWRGQRSVLWAFISLHFYFFLCDQYVYLLIYWYFLITYLGILYSLFVYIYQLLILLLMRPICIHFFSYFSFISILFIYLTDFFHLKRLMEFINYAGHQYFISLTITAFIYLKLFDLISCLLALFSIHQLTQR